METNTGFTTEKC